MKNRGMATKGEERNGGLLPELEVDEVGDEVDDAVDDPSELG